MAIGLAPGEEVKGPRPANSGGVTRGNLVTVVGRTTPNSIVFTDGIEADYSFRGLALPADSRGEFSYKIPVELGLSNTEYLVLDPFGHRTVRAYPILRLPR